MIQDSTGRKVGEGAIINTMTNVTEQPSGLGQRGNDVTVNARPVNAHPVINQSQAQINQSQAQSRTIPVAGAIPIAGASSGLLSQQELDRRAQINQSAGIKNASSGIAYDKQDSSATAEPHQHGLLCKVKHALGMESNKETQGPNVGEPRSSDSTKRV